MAERTIPDLVTRWATRTPDAIALECHDSTMTYRALDEDSSRVAGHIADAGVAAGSTVAVSMRRSLKVVVAILGVLKAGCGYIPLDPDAPDSRNAQIIAQTSPALALVDRTVALPLAGIPLLRLEESLPRTTVAVPPAGRPDLAYVMPTSGSKGVLKLVEVTHHNVCYNVQALGSTLGGIRPEDVYLHFASFSFSSSVRQLFLPLSSGARVVVAVGSERLDPQEATKRIRRSRVTVLDLIPSFLAVLVEALEGRARAELSHRLGGSLRLLLLASERLPGDLVRRWDDICERPAARIYNMYGQTETAGIVCVHPVDPATVLPGTVPLGRPILNSDAYLLDNTLNPVAEGDVGEIVVAGGGLARGYSGDAALTAVKFPSLHMGTSGGTHQLYRTGDLGRRNADGSIEFIGRQDSQVKVRGHRVDLVTIERALEAHEAVAEAAVADITQHDGETCIRAFVRCRAGFIDERVDERIRTLPNGLRILDLNPPETDFMYEEIFAREVYLQHGIALPEDACVIDAGANIGLFSLSVAIRLPSSRVFAFEPAPPAADILRTNLMLNGCSNVRVQVQGFSDRRGTAALTFYPHSAGMSSIHASHQEERATLTSIIANQIRCGDIPEADELREITDDLVEAKLVRQSIECILVRLSDFLDSESVDVVDLLKVDIQKSELELLGGIRDEHWERIKQLVVEVHNIDGRRDRMTAELSKRGYTVNVEQDPMFAGSDMYYIYARRDTARPQATSTVSGRRPAPARLGVVSSEQLMSFLTKQLSAYQMPESVAILSDFPRTVSGKVDRSAIARYDAWPARQVAAELAEQRPDKLDPILIGVMAVWAEVLGKPVRVTDDFFETGGNSLSAARVITRVRERYTRDVPIRLIFEESRLGPFAAKVRTLLAPPVHDHGDQGSRADGQ